MAKGTALHRALAFFREESDEDVVRLALERATEIVAERGMRGRKPSPRRTRKEKTPLSKALSRAALPGIESPENL